MKIGVVNDETWAFFDEIYAEFERHHQVQVFHRRTLRSPLFQERLNRRVFQRDWVDFHTQNDVIFFEWASELLAASSKLPKMCGIVTRLHRYEMYQWVDQIDWERVDRLILVSRAKQREFTRRFPQHAAKTVVIPEAVSLEHFHPQPRSFNGQIGILCHLTPRKRVYELILAFYELERRHPGFRLHIGGGEHPLFGDYYRALHRLVEQLGLQDKVVFYGKVDDARLWHARIDIFISNSYSEGLQVSPMEAIAGGGYCLSHAWDGADELLPADSLYLTDGELIERILAFAELDAAGRQAKIDCQAALVRERFDMQRIKVQIRELVEQVGDEWSRRRPA